MSGGLKCGNYCHLKPPDMMSLKVFGARQRPNFNGFIYTHYAAPPYSARSGAIYLLPFGEVWLDSVRRVQCQAKQQNAKFMEGG